MEYNSIARFALRRLDRSLADARYARGRYRHRRLSKGSRANHLGVNVKGTLDVIIRDGDGVERVWDIKSASDWAFKNKFTGFGGYEAHEG